ncbi:MAG: sigma-70 family RNA polymerase sigma factor [Bdellovibrionales bacterium]|nr:sigma-70 family RNA polymerase sigma factor [Bdellovibrionales bacterium]
MELEASEITQLLQSYNTGDPQALEQLLPLIYGELKQLAGAYMRRENSDHTLQPTALVHEAYFRLVDQKGVEWKNRSHFFGIAAQLMRRILIDHARKKIAHKRGGKDIRVPFDEAKHGENSFSDILLLDDALKRLKELEPRQAQVVELRCFAGLSIEETAELLQTSPATVKRDWTVARAWLHSELQGSTNETDA